MANIYNITVARTYYSRWYHTILYNFLPNVPT